MATSATLPPVAPLNAPPPALVAPAPTVLAPPPSPVASGAEVDKHGLPWDARIHAKGSDASNPHPKNADGSWRQKRSTAKEYVASIEAELRATQTGVAAVSLASLPAPATGAVLPPAPPAAPTLPALPGVTGATFTTPAAPRAMQFADLATKVQPLMLSGKVTVAMLNAWVAPHGLAAFNGLIQHPQFVPAVDAAMSAELGIAAGVVA
jgi:hypothetical protein